MIKRILSVALCAMMIVVAACGAQKQTATDALNKVETELGAVRDDASRYASDQLAQVDAAVTAAKDNLAKGDYKAVLAAAPDLTAKVASLKDAIASG